MNQILDGFVARQRELWPLADKNFSALEKARTKTLRLGDETVLVQFNPDRIISSAAKTDKASLSKRPCFLCPAHRFPEQIYLPVITPQAHSYDLLLNPFPIFPNHLVIALSEHRDQGLDGRLEDLLFLADFFKGYTFFYNGPSCGASAPDHHHFQGLPSGIMPLEKRVKERRGSYEELSRYGSARLYRNGGFYRGIYLIEADDASDADQLYRRLMASLPIEEGESEPRINAIAFAGEKCRYQLLVVLRKCHRSHHFYAEGKEHLLMSPGCADMTGYFITPQEEDFNKLDEVMLAQMVDEIIVPVPVEQDLLAALQRQEQQISVGILSAPEILFELGDGKLRRATLEDGMVCCDGKKAPSLRYNAPDRRKDGVLEPFFHLHKVKIGKGFHWEQEETQVFAGDLEIIVEDGCLTAVNHLPVEDYLLSVIASEMSATAPLEFLKAHAVISRSWVLNVKQGRTSCGVERILSELPWEKEYERWYGGGAHKRYDVCADDHCQRYQGLTRPGSGGGIAENVRRAVKETAGQVLLFDGQICDARFHKCCGGKTERFSVCWEDEDKAYLQAVEDPWCAQADAKVLHEVLNDYDEATRDWYEWEECYSREELTALIQEKSGYETGLLQYIKLMEKGSSGRWYKIALCGEKRSLIVGKELEIRRLLSRSHLKSSAFELEYRDAHGRPVALQLDEEGNLQNDWASLCIKGRGWGHGVGLCQIGAAVMASKGWDYRRILSYYYPETSLK